MIKLLLADTDADSLRNFRTYIRTAVPDVRIVGGVSGLARLAPAVREYKPDVVLADIRFFGVFAVQTIRELNDSHPDMRFLIYGTYNDAEYIEKVMEFGVIDYMFRPVKPAELERCLKRAVKVFDELARLNTAKARLIADYKNEMPLFRERFLTNLLDGIPESEFEIESSLRYFGLKLSPPYTVFTVRIDHFKTVILTVDEQEKHLLIYQIQMILNEKLARRGAGVSVMNRFNAVSVILSGETELYPLIDFCEEIKTEVLYQTKFSVTVGIGRTYDTARQIAVSAREADAALRYRHYMGYHTIIPIHFVDPENSVTYHYPKEKEELLVYAAVTGEYPYCETLLKKLIDALKASPALPERHVPKIMMQILIAISRYAGEQRIPNENMFTKFFNSREIFELQTLDDAYRYLSGALKNFCEHMVSVRDVRKRATVETVKTYVAAHVRENISLANMAMLASTTPDFLSAIFKQSEGCSLYEYTAKVKLERARVLMRETVMDDEAIANDVGYDDVRLFRTLFKQHSGQQTHEYRAQILRAAGGGVV